jgi:hypothetical protein
MIDVLVVDLEWFNARSVEIVGVYATVTVLLASLHRFYMSRSCILVKISKKARTEMTSENIFFLHTLRTRNYFLVYMLD